MNTSTILRRLAGVAAGLLVAATATFAQVNTDVAVTVTNGASVKSLAFGINVAATEAIDAALGEQSLPPFPPAGVYEARFINFDGTTIGQGSPKNYRPSPQVGAKSYRVKWQPATGTPQILVTWDPAAVNAAYTSATITPQGGTAINMTSVGSLTVADGENDATYATITVSGPKAPPSPLEISSTCPIDFGTLNLPTGGTVSSTEQLTLRNNTASAITVDSIVSSDPNFTIDATFPLSVAPGTSNIDVTFDTDTIGTDAALVTVYYGASSSTCDASVNVVSGEGLYWTSTSNAWFDNSPGRYSSHVGLQYSGATPLNGIQFVVTIPNRVLNVANVVIGEDVATPENWEFLYRVTRTTTASEVKIVLYAKDGVSNLPAGDYDQLVRIDWNVANITDCDGAAGGDARSLTATLSQVESSLFGDEGADGGVGVDANRDEAAFLVLNSSARGDVNCDDLVDVMDVLDVNDRVLGLMSFADWQTNRADLAPWSSYWATVDAVFNDSNNYGNGEINVGDLTLLVNAILNENWPDNTPLRRIRTAEETSTDGVVASAIYDVKLTYDIDRTGVRVSMENLAPVKGIQMKLKAVDAADVERIEASMSESLGVPFSVSTLVKDGEVRLIAITKNGLPIAPRNGDLMSLVFPIVDPTSVVVIEPITIGGADNRPLVVEYVVNARVSGVAIDEIVTGLETVPNPLTTSTELRFTLERTAPVSVVITDANGSLISTLVDRDVRDAGQHVVTFDADGLAAGTYFATITIDGASTTRSLSVTR
jgi:hypothetical protein